MGGDYYNYLLLRERERERSRYLDGFVEISLVSFLQITQNPFFSYFFRIAADFHV